MSRTYTLSPLSRVLGVAELLYFFTFVFERRGVINWLFNINKIVGIYVCDTDTYKTAI
jgi:hypothetical protein